MRRYKLEKLLDIEIGRDEIFRTAKKFTESEAYETTCFYRRIAKQSKANATKELNKQIVFNCMENTNKLRQFGEGTDRKGQQIWHLAEPKMEICEDIAEHLHWDVQKVYRHFPDNVKSCNKDFHKCAKCIKRKEHIKDFNRTYNGNWNHKSFENRVYTEEEIKNNLRIKSRITGNFKKLNASERQTFHKNQETFKALETHFLNKKKSGPFWNKMLHQNNIPPKCVVWFFDYSGSQHLGENTKNKSVSRRVTDNPSTDYVIPLGVVFCYSDQEGVTQYYYCLCIPDTVSLTAHEAISMVEELLAGIDGDLRDILQNANRFIVIKAGL